MQGQTEQSRWFAESLQNLGFYARKYKGEQAGRRAGQKELRSGLQPAGTVFVVRSRIYSQYLSVADYRWRTLIICSKSERSWSSYDSDTRANERNTWESCHPHGALVNKGLFRQIRLVLNGGWIWIGYPSHLPSKVFFFEENITDDLAQSKGKLLDPASPLP